MTDHPQRRANDRPSGASQLPCRKSDVEFVIWKDAVSQWSRGQLDEASELGLARNVNIGWVVHENEERIVFCNGTSSTGEMDHLVIPTANVVERIRLARRSSPAR